MKDKPSLLRGIHNVPLLLRRRIMRALIVNQRLGGSNLDLNSPQLKSIASKKQLKIAVNVLSSLGYIELTYAGDINFAELSPSSIVGIQLTSKGEVYFEISTDRWIMFLFKSILVPIAVSLITSLIAVNLSIK